MELKGDNQAPKASKTNWIPNHTEGRQFRAKRWINGLIILSGRIQNQFNLQTNKYTARRKLKASIHPVYDIQYDFHENFEKTDRDSHVQLKKYSTLFD